MNTDIEGNNMIAIYNNTCVSSGTDYFGYRKKEPDTIIAKWKKKHRSL